MSTNEELDRKQKQAEEWCKNEEYQKLLNVGIRLNGLRDILENKKDLTKEEKIEIQEQIVLCEKIYDLLDKAHPWTTQKPEKEEHKEEILELKEFAETEEGFDVEESARLAEFGITVLKTKSKKKLYARPIKLTKKQLLEYEKFGIKPEQPYEFEPISTDAMRKAKISESQIEESENFANEQQNSEIED